MTQRRSTIRRRSWMGRRSSLCMLIFLLGRSELACKASVSSLLLKREPLFQLRGGSSSELPSLQRKGNQSGKGIPKGQTAVLKSAGPANNTAPHEDDQSSALSSPDDEMKEKSTEELEDPQQEDTKIEQYQPVQVTKKAQQPPVYIQEIGPSLPEDGTSSMPAHILNLTKNILGAGMLSLPAGMAAGQGSGPMTALSLLIFSGVLSAYTFYTLGISAERSRAGSMRALWARTLGRRAAGAGEAVVVAMIGGLLVLFLCFCGDLFASLARAALLARRRPALAGAVTPNRTILALSVVALLPLCLLRDLSALSASSAVGLGAVFYIAALAAARALDGTYRAGGAHFRPAPAGTPGRPAAWARSAGTLVLVNCLATSFSVHPNAVKFYRDLRGRSPRRFGTVVAASFFIAALVNGAVMLAGHHAFGMAAQGLVLNNFAAEDAAAVLGRAATGASLVTSFPLQFAALRDSVFGFLGPALLGAAGGGGGGAAAATGADALRAGPWAALTAGLLGALAALAAAVDDPALLVALLGSIGGALTMFVIPGAVSRALLRQDRKHYGIKQFWAMQRSHLIIFVGMVMMIAGTYVTLA